MPWTNHEMKKHNVLKVFNTLRNTPSVSRRTLAAVSGLSWGTVSAVCAELLRQEIVVAEKHAFTAGRPGETLTINGKKNLLLGIDINSIGLSFSVIDLSGGVAYTSFASITDTEKDAVLGRLKEETKKVLESFPSVLAIGLSMQGTIRRGSGISVRTNYFKDWKNVPLTEIMSQSFHLPVYLYHDPECLLAYNRKHNEEIKNLPDGIVLRVDNGVGMAIVSDGEFPAEKESAMEIGHTVSVPNGRKCMCGKNGCLEAYAALRGMNERYAEYAEKQNVPLDFLTALQRGDEYANTVCKEAAYYLGVAVTNLYTLFSPSFILLDGYAFFAIPSFFEDVKKNAENCLNQPCPLVQARYEKAAPAIGAAYLTIDKIIEGVLFS